MKTVFLVLGVILLGISIIGCGSSIPKKINETIFERSEFSVPIILSLPSEDDPKYIEQLKNEVHTLMPVFYGSANQIDKGLLEVLVRHGFVNVRKITVKWSTLGMRPIESSQHDILVYSDKIRPYIHNGDFKKYGGKFEIRLASRLLKSIDYTNEHKDPLRGPGKIFAGAFSYTLKKDLPCLEELVKAASSPSEYVRPDLPYFLKHLKIDKTYKGKAEAYLDPADGHWKLGSIVLEDKSPAIFKNDVAQDEKKLVPDDRKVFETSISGKYVVKDIRDKSLTGAILDFRKNGTCTVSLLFKWKIEGNLLKFSNGSDEEAGRILDNTIKDPRTNEVTMVKQEEAKLINKIEGGKLWSKYTLKKLGTHKDIASLEFIKDGTGILTYAYGKWKTQGEAIRIDIEGKELKGKTKNNIIELEEFGTLVKQAPSVKTSIFIAIIIVGVLLLLALVVIGRKIIWPSFSKVRVVPKVIFCTQCGNQNPATASFCTNCGHKLE